MQKHLQVKGRYKCERKSEKRGGRRVLYQNRLIEQSPQSFDDKKINVQSIVENN